MGYQEDIKIDIDQLDQEWIKQASLYQYYAKQEAMALYKRDQLAEALALTQAQLDGEIRLDPKKHGFESKPTEAAILNSIKQNPFYIKDSRILMKATCKAKIIGSAVRSFDHKKKALEKLSDLYLSGYWAGPKIKSEAQELYGKQTRMDLEDSLRREDRLVKASLKKEAAATNEKEKKADKATKAEKKLKAQAQPKVEAAARARAKVKAKSVDIAKAETKAKGKGKAKPKVKTKPGSRPIGRTKEELSKQGKQQRPKPSPKPPKKKNK